ncbi:uL15 family ribosomal protein [Candidatus Pacearchaeota archaeon]|nr:uL15 family ribosomal protein [Candidatus Pacearchaeota archaeon]
MKTHKRQKSSRMHGRKMGTHGGGARKKNKGSGHRGGKGMSGSGKRNDQKKTLVLKKYGHGYFGKQGITSRKTQRDIRKRINLRDIELNLKKYSKKTKNGYEINLEKYKILGTGDVKNKLIIKAKEASKSAIEKVEAKAGKIILLYSPKEASDPKTEIKKTGGKKILPKKKVVEKGK